MTFAKPFFLTLLILVPLAALFLAWAERQRRSAIARLGNPTLIERLTQGVNWRGRRWQTGLWLVALTFVLLALARPQWGGDVQPIEQEGLQVLVALDVSQSMLASDIKPNRLERAKLEIRDLMTRLNGDEIGLVLFSGASFLQTPLTSDYTTALAYLDNATPAAISRQGTVIGDAVRTALHSFDDNLPSQKVLVVMTDGEDSETDPLTAAQAAADAGVIIYTIGFGTSEGAPIPNLDQRGNIVGYKTDALGQTILSKLNADELSEIAKIGNGQYFAASATGSELDALLAQIDTLQRAQLETRFETKQIERFQLFLVVALVALISAELIPERSRSVNANAVTVNRWWKRGVA